MLTPEQVDAVTSCISLGAGTEFEFEDAPLCAVLDEIIEHLESERLEATLFGITPQEHEIAIVSDPPTTEEEQRMFVHHAMHWAFQLGVGAALKAVGHDLSET